MKSTDQTYPKLRNIEAIPIQVKGQPAYYVRDPLEIATSPLVLPPQSFFILTRLDGRHSFQDIKLEFARAFSGVLLFDGQLEEVLAALENNYYLDDEAAHARSQELQKQYSLATVRSAWHAGKAYEDDPDKLRIQIDSYYNHPKGAGRPEGCGEQGLSQGIEPGASQSLTAIMVPHIDLRVGGPCYTHAYRYLFENMDADLFIILGVAHFGGDDFFIATSKDFETPFGVVKTDREFLESWGRHAGTSLSTEEWVHRTEHSVEFQLLFLQHGLKKPFEIVPVLLGASEPFFERGINPTQDAEIARILESLQLAIRGQGKRVVIILSVDLSHVGPKFGDPDAVTSYEAQRIENADRKMLETVTRLDAPKLYEQMSVDMNRRRVDACSALLTLLAIMQDGEGKLLSYDQDYQPDTKSLVSFASMIFLERSEKNGV